MQPEHGPNYDFIMNPNAPKKKGVLPAVNLKSGSMKMRILIVLGGAFVLGMVIWGGAKILFSNDGGAGKVATVVAQQTELIRMGENGIGKLLDNSNRNFVATTLATTYTSQRKLKSYLSGEKYVYAQGYLTSLKDNEADKKLVVAASDNKYDEVFIELFNARVKKYQSSLITAKADAPKTVNIVNSAQKDLKILLAKN